MRRLSCHQDHDPTHDLLGHVETVHDKDKMFKCDNCNFSTYQSEHLKCHIEVVHKQGKQYKCVDCHQNHDPTPDLVEQVNIVHN